MLRPRRRRVLLGILILPMVVPFTFFCRFPHVRSLVKQLVSSAAEMAGDGWYRQQRLVDLASAERETRRAALGGGSSSVAGSGATSSRGRSLQRGSQGNKSNDEGSRSRSRSFNLPMRSWAAGPGRSGGERRQRWASQDSARETDADEDPDMPNAKMDGSDSIHSAASGSKNGSTDERLGVEGRGSSGPGEEELERTARSRSFFSFGRRGRPKMLGTPAVDESEEVERDTNRPGVEGKSREQGDSSRGRGDRRRSASTAAVERRDATGGFDSGRARGLTDASELREAENSVQNSSRVAESGTSASTTGSHAFPYRNSTRDRLVHSKSLRAFDGGSEMSPGQLNLRHARQGTSVEAGRLDDATLSLRQRAMSIAAALERKDGSEMDGGQGGRGDGSSKGASRWTFSRRSRLSKNSALKGNEDESGAGTGSAVEKDKKGIFRTQVSESLQNLVYVIITRVCRPVGRKYGSACRHPLRLSSNKSVPVHAGRGFDFRSSTALDATNMSARSDAALVSFGEEELLSG